MKAFATYDGLGNIIGIAIPAADVEDGQFDTVAEPGHHVSEIEVPGRGQKQKHEVIADLGPELPRPTVRGFRHIHENRGSGVAGLEVRRVAPTTVSRKGSAGVLGSAGIRRDSIPTEYRRLSRRFHA